MNCIKCGDIIPEGRLKALPGAKTCVNCSGVQKKGAVTIMKGTGDHTWIETIHLEHEDYKAYVEAENKLRKSGDKLFDPIEEPQPDIPYGFREKKINKKEEE
jgi:hypothetical protein